VTNSISTTSHVHCQFTAMRMRTTAETVALFRKDLGRVGNKDAIANDVKPS